MSLFDLPRELIGYIIQLTEYENNKILPFIKFKNEGSALRLYKFNGLLKNTKPEGYGYMISSTLHNESICENINQEDSTETFETIWIYVPLYNVLARHNFSMYFLK